MKYPLFDPAEIDGTNNTRDWVDGAIAALGLFALLYFGTHFVAYLVKANAILSTIN